MDVITTRETLVVERMRKPVFVLQMTPVKGLAFFLKLTDSSVLEKNENAMGL
jgi:hypothetical protein